MQRVNAQQVNGSSEGGVIKVSPAISYLKTGDPIKLIIENDTEFPFSYSLSASTFDLNLEERSVKRLENIDDVSLFFTIKEEDLFGQVEPNNKKIIEATYIGSESNTLVGIIVSQTSATAINVGVSTEFASLVIDQTLSIEDKGLISDNLDVKPSNNVLGFNLSNKYKIQSDFSNDTNKLLKISGEITVKDGKKYLANYAMSQYLLDPLFPGDQKEFQYTFIDNRSFWDRFGETEFIQTYVVNGESYISSYSVFTVPAELIWLGGGLFVVLVVSLIIRSRRNVNRYESRIKQLEEEVAQSEEDSTNKIN
ncbi:hypothetical protein KC678_02935 [Candidatus Dojkabacteria bacterium]|uniref:Uncharacterized protein n=1 Tax=Candidatus Dojkabacteria bacterium TaxID=2099670 RepID=A0A955L1M7_9BACT|nr:hypothetical protein [Candidatus Dojkabacteria bacterium]